MSLDDFRQDRDEWNLERAADHLDRQRDFDELHGQHRVGVLEYSEWVADEGRRRAAYERRQLDRPEGPPRCDCAWSGCPHTVKWWHDLSRRSDVKAGAPSSWWGMIAAGLDPTTGDPLPGAMP
jgi:hypothetical protein